ncbi:MAG: protein arginine kinase [Clostridia bacterium]|nr:protein arginine kinase [Clostridia bacterium]
MMDVNSVVISSRIRLARSLKNYVFPSCLVGEEGYKVIKEVADVVTNLDGEYKVFTMERLPALDAEVMQEKHLISSNLLNNKASGAVILSDDETISIMVNEEDHIRAQCFMKGLSLGVAYETLNKIDDALIENLDIAYDDTLGFLNSCITNVGTGMRASVMLFLPALTLSNQMNSVINNLSNQRLTVRGVFGEGSEAQGYLYQVSNARSLGVTEKDIINKVIQSTLKLCELELEARKLLVQNNDVELKDRVFRAWGVLTNAYTLSADEFMKCAGEVKIGIALGFIKLKDNSLIDKLLFDALPSSLTQLAGQEVLGEKEEKMFRAKFISTTLKSARIK